MKEVLKPVKGRKGPKYVHNHRIAIEKRRNPLYQIRPLLYDVYDFESYQYLGTCGVYCQAGKDRSVVLMVVRAGVPEFAEILEVANRKLST